MGVTGKLELWRSLANGVAADGLGGMDRERLQQLEQRAEDQRRRLEDLHAQAAGPLVRDR